MDKTTKGIVAIVGGTLLFSLYSAGVQSAHLHYSDMKITARARFEKDYTAIANRIGEINSAMQSMKKENKADQAEVLDELVSEQQAVVADYRTAEDEYNSKSPWKSWAYLFE